MKRVLAILLAILLITSLVPAAAWGPPPVEETPPADYVAYPQEETYPVEEAELPVEETMLPAEESVFSGNDFMLPVEGAELSLELQELLDAEFEECVWGERLSLGIPEYEEIEEVPWNAVTLPEIVDEPIGDGFTSFVVPEGYTVTIVEGGAVYGTLYVTGGEVYLEEGGSIEGMGSEYHPMNALYSAGIMPFATVANRRIVITSGTVTMSGGTISGHSAQRGGAVHVSGTGHFIMTGGTIRDNTAIETGGGVHVSGANARFTMNGGTIRNNTVTRNTRPSSQGVAATFGGGGVSVMHGALFTMNGASAVIESNQTLGPIDDTFLTGGVIVTLYHHGGGGVSVIGPGSRFTLQNGIIRNNTAGTRGGGVHASGGALVTMTGGTIGGTTAQGNHGTSRGGGVSLSAIVNSANRATLTMSGGTISGNRSGGGGGITGLHNTVINLQGTATVTNNTTTNNGGGVWLSGGAQIHADNRADIVTLNISGSARITNNTASFDGGGIHMSTNTPRNTATIMTGGDISGNSARRGGGVYVATTPGTGTAGRFTMSGGTVRNNSATAGDGGGVYSTRRPNPWPTNGVASGYDNLNITVAAGNISGNTASTGGWTAPSSGTVPVPRTLLTNHQINWRGTHQQVVTFNPNGGTWPAPASNTANQTRSINRGAPTNTYAQAFNASDNLVNPTQNRPTRDGWTFTGWWSAASGGTRILNTTAVSTAATRTLFAQWVRNTQVVSFDPNGGTWPSPANNTAILSRTINRGAAGDTYAQAFNASDNLVNPNQNHPTRPGFIFSGWVTTATGTTRVLSTTAVSTAATRTLFARWVAQPTQAVTFNPNGGTWPAPANGTANQMRTINRGNGYTYAQAFNASDNLVNAAQNRPTRAGWTFTGWWSAASGGTRILSTTEVSTATTRTLFAQWTRDTQVVTFNPNSGTWPSPANGTANQTRTINRGAAGDTYAQAFNASDNLVNAAQNHPTRNGYTFTGWWTAATGGTRVLSTETVSTAATRTLFAQWTRDTQVVIFNPNSGTWPAPANGTANQMRTINRGTGQTYAQAFNASDNLVNAAQNRPTRAGWTFTGWWTAASGGTRVLSTAAVSADTTRTLFAQWTRDTQVVTFNPNNGTWPAPTNGTANLTRTINRGAAGDTYAQAFNASDNLVNATQNRPTRAGWTFTGWWTAASGGTRVLSTAAVSTDATRTLFAQWTRDTQVVIFNPQGGTWPSPANGTANQMRTINRGLAGDTYAQAFNASDNLVNAAQNHPTRNGYTFAGWWTAATGGTQVFSTTAVSTAATRTLFAQWTQDTQIVIFNPQNGTWPVPANNTANQMRTINRGSGQTYAQAFGTNDHLINAAQPIPTRNGWTFTGWWTAPTGGTRVLSTTPVSNDTSRTLHAQWTATYHINFTLYTDRQALLDTFGGSATVIGGQHVIRVPVIPGAPRSTWPNQALLNAAMNVGNIYGVAGTPGHAFWGWFDNPTLNASGRINATSGLRRPALANTCLVEVDAPAVGLLTQIEAGTTSMFTSGNLDLFAIWSLWGDVDDNDLVEWNDLEYLRLYLLMGWIDPTIVTLNRRAADVEVNGLVEWNDLELLRLYLLMGWIDPTIVLGVAPPTP